MPDDERDDQPGPGGEGFLADMLRQSTITGTEDDPKPPEEPPDPNRGTTEEHEPDADES